MRVGDYMILGHWDAGRLAAGSSLRPGDMRLIKTAKLINFELYNLRDDLGQEKDLAKKEPERLAKLKALLVKKYREVQEEGPTWQLGPRRKK